MERRHGLERGRLFLALESMSCREMEELDRLSRSLHRLYESERLVDRYDAMGVAVHDQHRHGDAIDVEDGRRVSESRSVLTWTAQQPLDERPLLWRRLNTAGRNRPARRNRLRP